MKNSDPIIVSLLEYPEPASTDIIDRTFLRLRGEKKLLFSDFCMAKRIGRSGKSILTPSVAAHDVNPAGRNPIEMLKK